MPVAILRERIEAAPSVLEKRTWPRPGCEMSEKAGPFEGRPLLMSRCATANLGAQEIWLVVEVSDSTFALDTSTKAGRYALAGIQGYRVLDVKNRPAIVHRSPSNGEHQSSTICEAAEQVCPLAVPEAGNRPCPPPS